MAGIEDFIQMAAQQFGESEGSTRSATGVLLGLIESKAEGGDFQQLLNAIPGAGNLLRETGGTAPEGSGGMLGGMLGGLASSIGGELGESLGALGEIQKTGFAAGNIGGLVSLFVNFAQSEAGQGLVQKLMGQVPELAKFAN